MTADLDALLDAAGRPPSEGCKYTRILRDVTDEQAAKLEALPGAIAARVLTQSGRPVSDTCVQAHRRGDCGC